MLDPYDRRLLLEALRPPEGYALDCAIGTSFSLDLLALLATPLAFTLFDWDEENGRPAADPYALLAALRENAERITLFCQGGQIAVPPAHQLLLSQLERCVVQVEAPKGGVFHPKVWVLRYASPLDETPAYRLVCMTRNLTFDASWDAILVLDGELPDRRRAFKQNEQLVEFVASLPGLASDPIDHVRLESHRRVVDELPRVRFSVPEGFEEFYFWSFGTSDDERWPFSDETRRMLVISPFLAGDTIQALSNDGDADVLVSRAESLDRLSPEQLGSFRNVFTLDSATTPDDEVASEALPRPEDPPVDVALTGLHAKVYVGDRGWDADVWVGSANATNAAFSSNVEFMVELSGKKSRCGIDAILGANGKPGLSALLTPYTPTAEPPQDEPQEALERDLDSLRRALASAPLELAVVQKSDGAYRLKLRGALPEVPAHTLLQAWPATLKHGAFAQTLRPRNGTLAQFDPVPLTHISPFVAFHAKAERDGATHEARFTIKLPLIDAPAGREEAVLSALFENQRGLLRFLLLLLAGSRADSSVGALASQLLSLSNNERASSEATVELPLLEALVQAVDRAPQKLRSVQRLIDDLGATEHGQRILGDELPAIWAAVWAAHEKRAV